MHICQILLQQGCHLTFIYIDINVIQPRWLNVILCAYLSRTCLYICVFTIHNLKILLNLAKRCSTLSLRLGTYWLEFTFSFQSLLVDMNPTLAEKCFYFSNHKIKKTLKDGNTSYLFAQIEGYATFYLDWSKKWHLFQQKVKFSNLRWKRGGGPFIELFGHCAN